MNIHLNYHKKERLGVACHYNIFYKKGRQCKKRYLVPLCIWFNFLNGFPNYVRWLSFKKIFNAIKVFGFYSILAEDLLNRLLTINFIFLFQSFKWNVKWIIGLMLGIISDWERYKILKLNPDYLSCTEMLVLSLL